RAIAPGDDLAIYHTGKIKAVVGWAVATSAPYPDPTDPKQAAIDLAPRQAFSQPVTLVALKADPVFADCDLIRLPRLSVVPLTPAHWQRLRQLGMVP
ncbi:MAG: EVE domain-containing protein, partial [Oscillatoriales cyanobacterium SM2_1_8]|nr:EVE domain-containing protein [Oscillatoriales cyanobacterium SM2_1_8]